jgi:arylformamidase
VPPQLPEGAPVWLDLDQRRSTTLYGRLVYAFNYRKIAERMAANNEKALAVIGRPERVAYGLTDIEKVDV